MGRLDGVHHGQGGGPQRELARPRDRRVRGTSSQEARPRQQTHGGPRAGSDKKNCYFVDLFVRVSNTVAINFYRQLGYSVYRTVLQYYSGENDEDAYDMRKALSRDELQQSVVPLETPVHMDELEY